MNDPPPPGETPPLARGNAFTVHVDHSWRYEVELAPGLIAEYGRRLAAVIGTPQVVVLTDQRVHRLHGARFLDCLRRAGFAPETLIVPPGETSKSIERFTWALERLARLRCDRRSVLINFGGGMVSDLGGFVASAYMRGIRYVNFATSLLGQLDACVGGKVAVNSPHAKNLFGAFHHPTHVAGDMELLATLSERDFRSGLAEGIKMAIIDSPELFEFIEDRSEAILDRDPRTMLHVVYAATRRKIDHVLRDPYERDLRRPLNFGHTLGHPIETEFEYAGIRHGEAVALGMAIATAVSLEQGVIDADAADRIYALLDRFGLLDSPAPLRPDSIVEHARFVRLVRGQQLNFVLPRAVGDVFICKDLPDAQLVRAIERFQELVEARRP